MQENKPSSFGVRILFNYCGLIVIVMVALWIWVYSLHLIIG